MNSMRTGVLLVLVAAFLFSTSGFFTQVPQLQIWPRTLQGYAIGFWRALFALIVLLPMVRRVSWKAQMPWMVLSFVVMNISFLVAMTVGSPATTIWIQYLSPVWVTFGAIYLFREFPSRRDWVMLGFCLAGVCTILVGEYFFAEANSAYVWWAPFAGVVLSIRSMPDVDPGWLISLNHIATAIFLFPFLIVYQLATPTGALWWVLIGLGILQLGLPYVLFTYGLRRVPTHIGSLLTLVEPILVPVWTHWIRSGNPDYKVPGWWTWAGALFILIGLVSRCVPSRVAEEA
jgi:drug/metabolite transporter, DME family